MTECLQKDVTNYIAGALFLPVEVGQFASMVILHFDIPDKQAKDMVELALIELARRSARQ